MSFVSRLLANLGAPDEREGGPLPAAFGGWDAEHSAGLGHYERMRAEAAGEGRPAGFGPPVLALGASNDMQRADMPEQPGPVVRCGRSFEAWRKTLAAERERLAQEIAERQARLAEADTALAAIALAMARLEAGPAKAGRP